MIALKRFGQNFLIDVNILGEIISRSNPNENDRSEEHTSELQSR